MRPGVLGAVIGLGLAASRSQQNDHGSMSLTFTDGLASGTTSQGTELSAKLR